ncbi:preprotein translocase subunit YajC [Saccharobesus litoralis]|uniref:Sec translocon accessory complex subunit YajC n=1 Tax=Saccharobesus litoralis TaxID=2172099 RepID=A0A2S0VMS7_9ALTE|nr:preprotein translocase subunit YajC [Saccharobesus litoralis]AWB65524.1 preprotein translocase subunit YajC [Saccharobesus litoralis]
MDLFIASAYANDAAQPQGGSFMSLVMLAVMVLIFYFLLYRPQAKRVKEHKNLVASLSKNDEVLTQGGLVGKITKVAEDKDFVQVSFADNVEIAVQKSAITAVLPKGTIKSI